MIGYQIKCNDKIKYQIIMAIQAAMYKQEIIDCSFKEVLSITNYLSMKYLQLELSPSEQQIKDDVSLAITKNIVAIPKAFLKTYQYKKEIIEFYIKHKQMEAINE